MVRYRKLNQRQRQNMDLLLLVQIHQITLDERKTKEVNN